MLAPRFGIIDEDGLQSVNNFTSEYGDFPSFGGYILSLRSAASHCTTSHCTALHHTHVHTALYRTASCATQSHLQARTPQT